MRLRLDGSGIIRAYELTVWDKPKPMARKRMVSRNGKVSVYPASKDVAGMYHIRKAFLDDIGGASLEPEGWAERLEEGSVKLLFPKDTPLALSLVAHVRCPASISKKARREGRAGWPSGRAGDLDNILKLVGDAFEGFVYDNDKQVKMYREPFYVTYAFDPRTGEDTRPHLYVRLEEV